MPDGVVRFRDAISSRSRVHIFTAGQWEGARALQAKPARSYPRPHDDDGRRQRTDVLGRPLIDVWYVRPPRPGPAGLPMQMTKLNIAIMCAAFILYAI